ncbi:cell wall integrity and stress response component 4-like [Brachionus plicatilis]|uniref:Cell wall integrity and stress response component 4-like n=1 Tax=Brachionus plicatilis TaxID=10195 RepID=A0A3M7SA27_BRAPC|nr:cell wall integrity and stress response component 4-like [Brachionus plicatilis]
MFFRFLNFLLFKVCLLSLVNICFSHGRLEVPAARNAAWRFGFNTPINYNDNELNCGGAGMQHATNDGKCGVCGDSYSGPRLHEAGGKYATGTIVKSYVKGTIMNVRVRLSANHQGNMEFRLCPTANKFIEVTKECLDENLLEIVGHGTSYPVRTGEDEINLSVKLPFDLICSHCVFQWKYRAGNSWVGFY